MSSSSYHDMALMAAAVQERVDHHPMLQPLRDRGYVIIVGHAEEISGCKPGGGRSRGCGGPSGIGTARMVKMLGHRSWSPNSSHSCFSMDIPSDPVLDLRAREMEMTAELVRRRLEELGCSAAFCYTETDVWLEEDGRRFSIHRWREWYRPSLETREDRAGEVAAVLVGDATHLVTSD